jgi:uncharacterized protein (UPF0548 family)
VRLVLGRGAPSAIDAVRWRDRRRTDEPATGMRQARYRTEVRFDDGEAAASAFEAARRRLLRYRIFPPAILRAYVDTPHGVVQEDGVVVFRAPLPVLPVAVEGAVRVVAVGDRSEGPAAETSVEIATVDGHPERGHERFVVALDRPEARLSFTIEASSRPGSILVRVAGPIGRWIQRRAAHAALREFASSASGDR